MKIASGQLLALLLLSTAQANMIMEIDLSIVAEYSGSPFQVGDQLTFSAEFDPNSIYTGNMEFFSPLTMQLELPDGSLTSLDPANGQLMIEDGVLCFYLTDAGDDHANLMIDLFDEGLDDLLSTLQWEFPATTDNFVPGVWDTDYFRAELTSLSIYATDPVPEPGFLAWSWLLPVALSWRRRSPCRTAISVFSSTAKA